MSGCVVGVWNSGFGFGSRVVGPGRILLMFLATVGVQETSDELNGAFVEIALGRAIFKVFILRDTSSRSCTDCRALTGI